MSTTKDADSRTETNSRIVTLGEHFSYMDDGYEYRDTIINWLDDSECGSYLYDVFITDDCSVLVELIARSRMIDYISLITSF